MTHQGAITKGYANREGSIFPPAIRDEGARRGEKQHSISRVAQPLTPSCLTPMKNCFQIDFSVISSTNVEKVTLQVCDDETDEGTSLFMQHIAKHMKNRQFPLHPECHEWSVISDTISRISSRLLYNPLVCRASGIAYIQPDSLYEVSW